MDIVKLEMGVERQTHVKETRVWLAKFRILRDSGAVETKDKLKVADGKAWRTPNSSGYKRGMSVFLRSQLYQNSGNKNQISKG